MRRGDGFAPPFPGPVVQPPPCPECNRRYFHRTTCSAYDAAAMERGRARRRMIEEALRHG